MLGLVATAAILGLAVVAIWRAAWAIEREKRTLFVKARVRFSRLLAQSWMVAVNAGSVSKG